jgi:hypothetical protein
MALALEQVVSGQPQRSVIVADEFAAVLDRVTAMVVARALRRAIDAANRSNRALGAIVATSHDDLSVALKPDTIVHCDFASTTVSRGRGNSGDYDSEAPRHGGTDIGATSAAGAPRKRGG